MTVQSIVWVLQQSAAEARTRCVAFALANRFDADQPLSCWPGMERIADEGKMAERTAQRCIEELVFELQELVVILNAGGPPNVRDDRRPNVYVFPHLLGKERLRELLAEYPRELIKIGARWSDCVPSDTATGCQPDTPLATEGADANSRAALPDLPATGCQPDTPRDGVSEMVARGVKSGTRGVSKIDARGVTVDTQSHIDPTEDPTGTLALGFARPPGRGRRRDELWDTMLAECGLAGAAPTSTERGAWNRAVKDLRAVNATPAEISRRARAFRNRWPGASLTPSALARRWNECLAGTTAPSSPAPVAKSGTFDDGDTLEDRARAAIEYLQPADRAAHDDELLLEGARRCLEQNPRVHVADLAIAAEMYADHRSREAG